MVYISPEAVEALNQAIREFEEYRPEPVVVFWLHDQRSEIVTSKGILTRRYPFGRPHSMIFPAKSTKSIPENERWEISGLRVIVVPQEYRNYRIVVNLIDGELVGDTELG